jgi:hypothetical protein
VYPDPAAIEPVLRNDPGEEGGVPEVLGREDPERSRDPREIAVVRESDDRRNEELKGEGDAEERQQNSVEVTALRDRNGRIVAHDAHQTNLGA